MQIYAAYDLSLFFNNESKNKNVEYDSVTGKRGDSSLKKETIKTYFLILSKRIPSGFNVRKIFKKSFFVSGAGRYCSQQQELERNASSIVLWFRSMVLLCGLVLWSCSVVSSPWSCSEV